MRKIVLLTCSTALLLAGLAPVRAASTVTLSRAGLQDRIRGGWAGQMIGVSFGAPTEFRYQRRLIEGDLEWKPSMIDNTIHQDDLYVEMTFAKVMDDLGLEAPIEAYGAAFRDSKYHLWHANAGARRALNRGLQPPWSGHPKYNVHADDIDFQIEADFIGLMCPGLPRESNRFCDRVGRVMNHGDGLYGGMFVCGMYAAGYVENDLRTVVESGLACIPAKSAYARVIRDVLDWSAAHPGSWETVWRLVTDKWDRHDPCPDGALRDFNIDAKINGAFIALGLLFGEGDFRRTVEISTRCGQDSDCNPSNAAGILGVMLGYERIPEEFKANLPLLADQKFDYTDYSFNDIVRSTEKRALELIRANGGTVTDETVTLKPQSPRAAKLEQWAPGIPSEIIANTHPAWQWDNHWQVNKGARSTTAVGAEATLEFVGTGIVLIGPLTQEGGHAAVFLDGEAQDPALDAYIVPNTHDNALWHRHGLKPGKHTLRIVTDGPPDPRSGGSTVAIQRAVVYR